MSRMFEVKGKKVKTLNYITGCQHNCTYCWARELVATKLKNSPKYRECGFNPALHLKEVGKSLGKNNTYFVVDMGDMWGSWVEDYWIHLVLDKCKNADRSNTFMFLTKNPQRYVDFFSKYQDYQDNFILGATIETNIDFYGLTYSNAPKVSDRYSAMKRLPYKIRKFVSIEPILNFDITLDDWIQSINPEFVYIGLDNHKNKLEEPKLFKTKLLIQELNKFTEVRLKTIRKAWNENYITR